MANTILGLIHNMKDYEHYQGQPFKLQKEEKDMLLAFLEQEDVQKCIPKVPRKVICGDNEVVYGCPICRTNIWKGTDKCSCGQKIKWMKENNEKETTAGSSIFDNFGIAINKQ